MAEDELGEKYKVLKRENEMLNEENTSLKRTIVEILELTNLYNMNLKKLKLK